MAPSTLEPAPEQTSTKSTTVVEILLALALSHLLNDTLQALLPSIYPMLKENFKLSFTQIGLITFTYQVTASLLQPFVGLYSDRHPKPYSLAAGMGITLIGLILISRAASYEALLVAAAMIGVGSSIFHPEASRVAHLAAGSRRGFAQSLFQVGGNLGTSFGPILAALVIVPHGQGSVAWFSILAFIGILVLVRVGGWYAHRITEGVTAKRAAATGPNLSPARINFSVGVLMVLVLSKYVYLVSLTNYYTFYLIHHFGVSIQGAQIDLGVFLLAIAAGTILGGPLGDHFGRKYVIWFSILGVAPFTIALPYVGLAGTIALSVVIGIILASAFSAILVFAMELKPGNVGLIAGLFFGLAFFVSGIASAGLGNLIDRIGIERVFGLCSFLPLMGLLTVFLPNLSGSGKTKG